MSGAGGAGVGLPAALQVALHLPLLLLEADFYSLVRKYIKSKKETTALCFSSPLKSNPTPNFISTAQQSESAFQIFSHDKTCYIKIKNLAKA